MKAIQLVRHGLPEAACQCIEVPTPKDPQPGELLVRIRASAINPADLLIFENRYPGPEQLPAFVGIEGAGEVVAVGEGVSGFKAGDKVISMGRANWAEFVQAPATQFIPVPSELDLQHAAQLKANPPSAHLMLTDYVDLAKGDWIIQNAANSAVGRHVISFCRERGINSINVVRRPELVDELLALGATVVVLETAELGSEVRKKAGPDAEIKLAIDAIGGVSTSRLADCLSNGGHVVNYGFLSGEPCQITPTHAIVRGISLSGFWLVGYMSKTPREQIIEMYKHMSEAFISGQLSSPVEAEYPLADISAALAHSYRESRTGKILLVS